MIREFWETCNTTFAHITTDSWLISEENLMSEFSQLINDLNPSDKVIIDYGIGGGYLGKYLLTKYNVNKYIGIDIAQRSLDNAKENLKMFKNIDFYLTPIDFSKLGADMFITHAVIQHFPDEEYLNDFLKNLNNSNIKEVILHIRYSKSTIFSNNYSTQEGVRLSCRTNKDYILKHMINYDIINEFDIRKNKNQALYLKIKNKNKI